MNKLRITWIKSTIGNTQRQRGVIRALGLRRLNQTIEKEDTPSIRGMVVKVSHLVKVESHDAAPT
ncbi:MAG: 50S ribosomal protein L30 [Dehalococcoidia bacterium]|nr:50S ribosomal protein L30 [Dehalococcoidia bacterium]